MVHGKLRFLIGDLEIVEIAASYKTDQQLGVGSPATRTLT